MLSRLSKLALLLTPTLIFLGGCAGIDGSSEDARDRLTVNPIEPEATRLNAMVGDERTFVIECDPPGQDEMMWISWDHVLHGERTENEDRQQKPSNEYSWFQTTFEVEGNHSVFVTCTGASDRSAPHEWAITVQPSDDQDQPAPVAILADPIGDDTFKPPRHEQSAWPSGTFTPR